MVDPLRHSSPPAHQHKHHHHVENHFGSSDLVRDIVIGMADGLTVPFALAAGISGANVGTRLIVVAGLAEIAAGSIAMGLGGYLAARTDAEHYHNERAREESEVVHKPDAERAEIYDIFGRYGITHEETTPIVAALERQPRQWVDFMMRFELGLDDPDPKRALSSGGTIALAYVVGGLVPLFPYMVNTDSAKALLWSAMMTSLALAVFGYLKGYFTGSRPFRSAVQTLMIGAVAATCAYALARLIS